MKKDLKKSIVESLDGAGDLALFPYFPYLLKDLWEMGTPAEIVINLINKHRSNVEGERLLDLGCGKGAVSVRAAKELGIYSHGIDGMPEFIAEAKERAAEFGVEHLCTFETGDIRLVVPRLHGYDIAVLGAAGLVFGDLKTTLLTVKECLCPDGCVFLNGWYSPDGTEIVREGLLPRFRFLEQINSAGMELIEEAISSREEMSAMNNEMYKKIERRALELIEKYPKKRRIFENYLRSQGEESRFLETDDVACGIFLLGKNR